jgi:hypothetical protein
MKNKAQRFTVTDFHKTFPDDDACLDALRDMIYPDGITCRVCLVVRLHHRRTGRKQYACDYCGTLVAPLAGTIFEKSSTPLTSWFYAMFIMSATRCGISAKQLERELGVTYKTAWRMFNQIRKLMGEDVGMLSGEVEVDEAYVGGRQRGGDGRPGRYSNKTPVVGLVQRRGKITALVTPDVRRRTVMPIIEAKVLPASMIYTDDYKVYNPLADRGYSHRRINHTAKVYVVGSTHTNTIEGFWSLLKNGIRGVYHSVSRKHLQSYVDEYTFRYNHRRDGAPMFRLVEGQVRRVRQGRYGEYAPIG